MRIDTQIKPREKLVARGIDALTDSDLIALLIGSGTKGNDYRSISNILVALFHKKLKANKSVQLDDIEKVDGVGLAKASQILAGIELGRRLYGGHEAKVKIKSSEDIFQMSKYLHKKKQEHLVGFYLNARYELLARRTINIGSIDKIHILPRDVLIPALELNAASIILVHNHPSGDFEPSKEDIAMTMRVREAAELIGVILLDHMVVTKEGWKTIN